MTRYVAHWSWPREVRVLARFELRDEVVVATYFDAEMEHYIEHTGIMVVAGTFRPSDGRAFMEALAPSYANSSRISVTEHDPTEPRDGS